MPCVNCEPESEEPEAVREYVKEVVEIDGVTVIRKVRETGCVDCHLYPFGFSLWTWGLILGGTVLIGLIFK